MTTDHEIAAERFVRWLDHRLTAAGRGDDLDRLEVDPDGRFWLGRLAPEEAVIALGWGDRGERIDPCAVGFRILPKQPGPWNFTATVKCRAWVKEGGTSGTWRKAPTIDLRIPGVIPASSFATSSHGGDELSAAITAAVGTNGLSAEVRVEVETRDDRPELIFTLVNTSPQRHPTLKDTNLYEVVLSLDGVPTDAFVLESLPDSFRFDRSVPAYGLNCGVDTTDGKFTTTDTSVVERGRPIYWTFDLPAPDLSFAVLAEDPLPSVRALVASAAEWGRQTWSVDELDRRQRTDLWTVDMRAEAARAAADFDDEVARMEVGIRLLENDVRLLRAFRLMNDAMAHAAAGKYPGWRPFQVGFLLSALSAITDPSNESGVVDILWFATGGGKTETYLGLLLTAALYDRLRGKTEGTTAWSRFPLRMLSLQQTQRFADALAGAELARQAAHIEGEPFSLGFLVGEAGTPNQIKNDPKEWEPDPDDDDMPDKFAVLLYCPFCRSDIEMVFNRRDWRLEHRCTSADCPWGGSGLPFHIVDYEIFRFLPTIVVGTLDKAALVAFQAAMRGLLASPLGRCSIAGHGFVYATRSTRPNGCLVPGCRGQRVALTMDQSLYAPTFRLQDELHLLRDSLGAVDAHYESLLDHLGASTSATVPKVVASSATLSGYARQVEVLYGRDARVFPTPGVDAGSSFWAKDTNTLMRRYVAVSPRGVTLEFAADRILTELQSAVRDLLADPVSVCAEIGVDASTAGWLAETYGIDVVYGNTLRDLDAAVRSLGSQVPIDPLNTESLTGRTPFEDVRRVLERLDRPEAEFNDRLHVVAASSMMSHGVDIDRLNVMVMLGLPLATAEFIQTAARIGRRWPGLVIVLHRIARERDAGVFRSFNHFIGQGDRFVEPIPITRRSRRVLERTINGLVMARFIHLYEPRAGMPLTTVAALRTYAEAAGLRPEDEASALMDALHIDPDIDPFLAQDLRAWFDEFFLNLADPGPHVRFPSELATPAPMRSLRDVEEQVPIRD